MGFALVYNWVDGEGLRPERELGPNEVHPRDRFCALPASEIIDALNVIFDVHILIEKRGFIAEDFYDGCLIYDFEKKWVHLYDFDHYHLESFINDRGTVVWLKSIHGTGRISERRAHRRKDKRLYVRAYSVRVAR